MNIKNIVSTGLIACSVAIGVSAVGAVPASVATCGWSPDFSSNVGGQDDGYYERGTYNHCAESGTIKIKINYTYASEEKCVTNGETKLYANPDLGALRDAVAIGQC
ncbi:DUF6355 family natural product biosynthesis protein [Rothia sp. HC945]|uniref:DUF6355 family natural product biosynthesis protein n=1 Tax=Rothia sp. HC945 TaxID=3171170 RepID=UPI003F1F1F51